MNNKKPYLSIVATSRNDDHGGQMLQRMQLFVNGLHEQCQIHNLKAELILVEWNPPSDRPPLVEAICWPLNKGHLSIRIITVPSKIHHLKKYSDKMALFQMIAKNVGIRRSMGEFILATNVDILFSSKLINFLASQKLQNDRMYRIDRYDVEMNVTLDMSIENILKYCRSHPIRIAKRNGTVNLVTGSRHMIFSPLRYLPMKFIPNVFKKALKNSLGIFPKFSNLLDEDNRLHTERLRLHTNASGDFTLMHRDAFFALGGYAEFEMFSFHIDSLLCYCAHHAGYKEKVLRDPMRIYHLEHDAGWTPEIEKSKVLKQRLELQGIPQLTNTQFDIWAVKMRRENKPMKFNNENWGLADDVLPEKQIT
jgi:hypothetical protein